MSRYALFDRNQLTVRPLDERAHDLDLSVFLPLEPVESVRPNIEQTAKRIIEARKNDRAVVLMMGGHVIRSGVQPFIIDLMERGLITCLAFNGACMIHDFELALIGQTTESVARYIKDGRFGLWNETGTLNEVAAAAAVEGIGLGEAAGRYIEENNLPYRETSLFAAAWRLGIPATVHVSIGQDIVHEHPNCDGAAIGAASYTDFLIYTACLQRLEGGVIMNFGSAVMGPEVYLKALAMVRNAAAGQGETVNRFTSVVADLRDLPEDCSTEAPKDDPRYYFRPWKTMLARTVADGGEGFYVRGRHEDTIPELWTAVTKETGEAS